MGPPGGPLWHRPAAFFQMLLQRYALLTPLTPPPGWAHCRAAIITSLILSLSSGFAASSSTAQESVTIGTGSEAGVYYQVGRALCYLAARDESLKSTGCKALSTAGSIFNLKNLRSGALHIAVAQSDWHYHAVRGSGPFTEVGPDDGLRSLFSVHGEPFTVVARRDAGITKLQDLVSKRVNIGNPGSGQRATMEIVMAALGWDRSAFSLADELPAAQQSLALCHDRVQAMIYTVGHPNASVGQAAGLCDAVMVEVSGAAVDKLIAENPFYAATEIPGGIYAGNPEPVKTFGVKATVVTTTSLDEDLAYAIVRSVLGDLRRFRKMHPAFGELEASRMIADGLSAPLHPGALRFAREAGLLTEG